MAMSLGVSGGISGAAGFRSLREAARNNAAGKLPVLASLALVPDAPGGRTNVDGELASPTSLHRCVRYKWYVSEL
jgi:hypothetical protein